MSFLYYNGNIFIIFHSFYNNYYRKDLFEGRGLFNFLSIIKLFFDEEHCIRTSLLAVLLVAVIFLKIRQR